MTRRHVVTDANIAPHFFAASTPVRVLRDNAVPRRGLTADRWLCQGKSSLDGKTIVQWLAAEDLNPRP